MCGARCVWCLHGAVQTCNCQGREGPMESHGTHTRAGKSAVRPIMQSRCCCTRLSTVEHDRLEHFSWVWTLICDNWQWVRTNPQPLCNAGDQRSIYV